MRDANSVLIFFLINRVKVGSFSGNRISDCRTNRESLTDRGARLSYVIISKLFQMDVMSKGNTAADMREHMN